MFLGNLYCQLSSLVRQVPVLSIMSYLTIKYMSIIVQSSILCSQYRYGTASLLHTWKQLVGLLPANKKINFQDLSVQDIRKYFSYSKFLLQCSTISLLKNTILSCEIGCVLFRGKVKRERISISLPSAHLCQMFRCS